LSFSRLAAVKPVDTDENIYPVLWEFEIEWEIKYIGIRIVQGAFMKTILFSIVAFFATRSIAAYNGYDRVWPRQVQSYFQAVEKTVEEIKSEQESSSVGSGLKCKATYSKILQKQSLNINYALGYFDESYANSHKSNEKNISASLDIISFDVIRNYLQMPCVANESGVMIQKLCGFQESGNPEDGQVQLSKNIEMNGRQIRVTMTLTHSSASEVYSENKTTLYEQQRMLTSQSEQNFLDGLRTADVVFYNGHSRDGGGPDFAPPVLRSSDLHVDYNGYYKVKKIGIRKTLSAMKESGRRGVVLGLFSCFSRNHFQKTLQSADPTQKLILTEGAIDYLNTMLASLGYLEGILQGECGENLGRIVKQNTWIQNGFKSWNFR